MSLPRGPLLIVLALAAPAVGQLTPDQQADQAIAAARKAADAGDLPAARGLYQQFLQKFGGHPQATAARLGLALALLHQPDPDYAAAIPPLEQAASDGNFPDRGAVLFHLATAHRTLGTREKDKGAADRRFGEAVRWFGEARNWYAGKKQDDWSARSLAERADVELRLGRIKEARQTAEPFAKDAAVGDLPAGRLGLYYHGLACFLDRDYPAAGRSLNRLAPFADAGFGPHARYLVGRVLHLNGETAEAGTYYDGAVREFEMQRKAAAEALKQPDRWKGKPGEKQRLEALATGPVPEYVPAAGFHAATLLYEAGKFADALARFQQFPKDAPTSPLVPDAKLRVGFCQVQLKQYDDATKTLAQLADSPLADQALYWLAKAQLAAADTDDKRKASLDTFRKAADRANQLPDGRGRRGDILMDLGDALQLTGQFPPAVQTYEQVRNENLLGDRRADEVLQRLVSASGRAGQWDRSDQWAAEFKQRFKLSPLAAAVAYTVADNAFQRAVKAGTGEKPQRFADAGQKFQAVIDGYPEFEKASAARYAIGVCFAQVGNLEAAVKALDAIPGPDRTGELSGAAYLLADCLIRLAPAVADDALAENILREKLTAASGLLENYVASNPKAADAPDALLKLGLCLKRLGSTLADANERNQLLNKSREFFDKLAKEYPQTPQAGHARLEAAKAKALAGDRGGAMNDLRQFAGPQKDSPFAPLALVHLATLLREENKPADAAKLLDDARKQYEPGLRNDKDRAEWADLMKYHHAVALAESQKPADAAKLFEEVAGQSRGKAIGAEAALRFGQTRIAEGRAVIDKAKQERAKPNLKPAEVAAIDRVMSDGQRVVREAAERLDRWANEFRQAMPAGEPRARMLYDAAWAYRSLPMDERTAAMYRRLIDEFPDLALAVDARFEWAEVLADKADHAAAIKLLKEAIDKEPTDRPTPPDLLDRVRLRLGGCLFATKDYPAALAQFETVAGGEKSPYRPQAVYRCGEALYATGEFVKAAEKLAPFRDRGEWHQIAGVSDRAVLRLGQCQLAAKQWDAARQSFEIVVSRYGQSAYVADARYGFGWALQQQGKYKEAVGQFEEVTKRTTAEVAARAQTQIGLCRLAQKKYAEAAAALLAVPYTYDEFPEVGYAAALEAARALSESGKPEQAEKVLRKLLSDAPAGSEWAKAAAERLKK